jgi:hypothetical protein
MRNCHPTLAFLGYILLFNSIRSGSKNVDVNVDVSPECGVSHWAETHLGYDHLF